MTDHSIRDGINLVSAFQFFLAVACVIAAIVIFILGILGPINAGSDQLLERLILPIIGLMLSLSLAVIYTMVGLGLLRYSNTARMTAIFLGILGLMSGFVSVAGSVVINLTGNVTPNWVSIVMTGLMVICVYSILGFVDVFVLIFLLNQKVRALYYTYEEQLAENISA